ncbi:hypothetical protein DFS34DRAFT_601104 [Phlyctochytrium arcticum]|nr:hypothetical protein DFS34DRAFT_601104 [Phlyctochytrium arcticum]
MVASTSIRLSNVTIGTLPIDCVLAIAVYLTPLNLSRLSRASKSWRDVLKVNASYIYQSLLPRTFSPELLRVLSTCNSRVPFTSTEIDVESRCRRKLTSGGRDEDPKIKNDPGAVFHFLAKRQKIVVEDMKDAVERLAADERARTALIQCGIQYGTVETVPEDTLASSSIGLGCELFEPGQTTGSSTAPAPPQTNATSAHIVRTLAAAENHSQPPPTAAAAAITTPSTSSSPPPKTSEPGVIPQLVRPVTQSMLAVEALRIFLLLQWTVETLRIIGCAAIKASRSSPGYNFVRCKYVPYFLSDLTSPELRAMHHAIMNLGGKSYTSPSKQWRSDAQGFEVNHFEVIYLRPFVKKALADRGDWREEV